MAQGTPEAGTLEAGTPDAGIAEAGIPEAGADEAGAGAAGDAGAGAVSPDAAEGGGASHWRSWSLMKSTLHTAPAPKLGSCWEKAESAAVPAEEPSDRARVSPRARSRR
ncbi:hypothetical protein GCM10010199_37560 [Dactylosporangium roseum]